MVIEVGKVKFLLEYLFINSTSKVKNRQLFLLQIFEILKINRIIRLYFLVYFIFDSLNSII